MFHSDGNISQVLLGTTWCGIRDCSPEQVSKASKEACTAKNAGGRHDLRVPVGDQA